MQTGGGAAAAVPVVPVAPTALAGSGRSALVLRRLLDVLPSVARPGQPVRVLDCGGGSGTFAVPLARAGAHVTVLDISADALATLARRAAEAGVAAAVRGVAADVEALASAEPEQVDLVLAHGVLGAVDDVDRAFAGIAAAVRPGGVLSLVVANPAASVLARALAGDLEPALVELRELGAGGAAGPAAVERLCGTSGLVLEDRAGIGAFSDVVPGSALDTPAARDLLTRLDAESSAREPFASIAGRIHLLARRPVGAGAPPDGAVPDGP